MLETIYKRISQWLTNLLDSVVSVLKVLVQSRLVVRLPAPQRPVCAVLGNGPSLTDSLTKHLDFIRQTEIVCVNNFAHSPYFLQLRPASYVIVDPNYFAFTAQTPDRDDIRQTLDRFIHHVDWPMTLYVPQLAHGSYVVRQLVAGNAHIRIVYVNPTVVKGFRPLRYWLYRRNLGMVQAQTVVVAALFLMLNRGFRAVYLFGADQSWHEQIRISEQNELLMQQLHFYEQPKDVQYQPVYSDPHRTKTFSMAAQFLSLHKAFRGYEQLRDYADYLNIPIYNASSKSYIDAFPRVVPSAVPQAVNN